MKRENANSVPAAEIIKFLNLSRASRSADSEIAESMQSSVLTPIYIRCKVRLSPIIILITGFLIGSDNKSSQSVLNYSFHHRQ
jgi:hypothetical protein